jgi:hypothetical protein
VRSTAEQHNKLRIDGRYGNGHKAVGKNWGSDLYMVPFERVT